MPVYCYRQEETGDLIEEVMTCEEMEKREVERYDDVLGRFRKCIIKEKEVLSDTGLEKGEEIIYWRDVVSEQKGVKSFPKNYPQHSDAMGCHPEDAQEAYNESVKMGIPTKFDNEGRAIFESAGHRKQYCEAFGFGDKNAGYSDPVPQKEIKTVTEGEN